MLLLLVVVVAAAAEYVCRLVMRAGRRLAWTVELELERIWLQEKSITYIMFKRNTLIEEIMAEAVFVLSNMEDVEEKSALRSPRGRICGCPRRRNVSFRVFVC